MTVFLSGLGLLTRRSKHQIPCLLKTLTTVNCSIVDSTCICSQAAAVSSDMMPCLIGNCTMEVALGTISLTVLDGRQAGHFELN